MTIIYKSLKALRIECKIKRKIYMRLNLRTYGIVIDKNKFERISNKRPFLNKPIGGLWASPQDSRYGWIDWCEGEDFRLDKYSKVYQDFTLKESSKLLVINNLKDFMRCLRRFPLENKWVPEEKLIDFLSIEAAGYDGVYLTERGNRECHLPLQCASSLNSWDCESVVLFNLDCIEKIYEPTYLDKWEEKDL